MSEDKSRPKALQIIGSGQNFILHTMKSHCVLLSKWCRVGLVT